jgi:hypothetical protein
MINDPRLRYLWMPLVFLGRFQLPKDTKGFDALTDVNSAHLKILVEVPS